MKKKMQTITNKCSKVASVVIIESAMTFPKSKRGFKNVIRPIWLDSVTKVVRYGGVTLGTNYKRSVDNALNRSGVTESYDSGKSWHVYFNDFFEVHKDDAEKFYLQLQWTNKQPCTTDTTYMVGGKEATPEEVEQIVFWGNIKPHELSKRQIEQGVDIAEVRIYNCVAIENIKSIKQDAMTLSW